MVGGRRCCLILVVLGSTGLCLLLYSYKWSSPPLKETSWPSIKPSYFRSQPIELTTNLSHSKVTLTQKEMDKVKDCFAHFKDLLYEATVINRPEMERVRVESHSYLGPASRVVEVGGYTGEDAAKLIRKYDPYYLAMEPIPRYQKILMERYKENPKFTVLGYGLGRENKTLYLNIDSDATSLFRKKAKSQNTNVETAHIREITQVLNELDVRGSPVDLLTINCEGCEFELLELLVSSEFIKYFQNIQFQFHMGLPGISNQETRYCEIMTLLSRTHRPTFQYAYTWQSWKKM